MTKRASWPRALHIAVKQLAHSPHRPVLVSINLIGLLYLGKRMEILHLTHWYPSTLAAWPSPLSSLVGCRAPVPCTCWFVPQLGHFGLSHQVKNSSLNHFSKAFNCDTWSWMFWIYSGIRLMIINWVSSSSYKKTCWRVSPSRLRKACSWSMLGFTWTLVSFSISFS
jgi:hypothetical protein